MAVATAIARTRRASRAAASTYRWLTVPAVVVLLVVAAGSHPSTTSEARLMCAIVGVATAVVVLPPGALTAAAAIVIGAVSCAVGAALSGRYGRTADGLPARAASAILLTSGALMLTLAIASLAMRPARWPGVAVGVVLGAGALWAVTDLAIDPIGAGVALTWVPRSPLGEQTPDELGCRYSTVAFPATDGVPLAGWYLPAANGAAVVLLHGASNSRTSVIANAAAIARNGFGVLMFDSRGQGSSAGRAMDLGWDGDADIGGALAFLAARSEVIGGRVGVVGVSLGGEEAIGAAATYPAIAAVVAEGATYRVRQDWTPHHAGGALDRWREWLTFTTADVLSADAPPAPLTDALDAIAPRPVLLITSGSGREIEAGREFAGHSTGNVALWELPDTSHARGVATHPREWEERVSQFLTAALTPDRVTTATACSR